jgi:hypothetical protein
VLLTNFEPRKYDLVQFGVPTKVVSGVDLPKVDTRESRTARLEVTPEVRVYGRVRLGGLLGRLSLLLSLGVEILGLFLRVVHHCLCGGTWA